MKRRDLLTGMLAGTAAFTLPPGLLRPSLGAPSSQTLLSVVRRSIEVNGNSASVFGLQQADGSSGLRFRAGDAFDVLLRNQSSEPTIIHWHGLTPPWPSDGVADAPRPMIAAGGDRSFNFSIDRPGTYWMHAHTLQEQALLAAPLIVANPADAGNDEQEVVILLHDFSFSTPEELLAKLTKGGAGAMGGMSGMDMSGSGAMGGMDMSGGTMDLNDIDYDAYLANDRTLGDPQIVAVERGARVRLRIINGAASTAFTIDLGELEGQLIAVDGQDIEPVNGQLFPMTMGQRIDIRLQLPTTAQSFPILALREGTPERTGIILRPAGANVIKLAQQGDAAAPVLDLALEAQLKAKVPLSTRIANKSFDIALKGDMATYRWGIEASRPILVDQGDRVEVTMRNASMMAHPMHLHGHHFQVVGIDGARFAGAVRDTVVVPPMRTVTIAVDAANPGQWAFHCHHLYHMVTGMISTFGYRA
jgi:FtsP/CotA-like multicopper oxidase with cupredoxin domain